MREVEGGIYKSVIKNGWLSAKLPNLSAPLGSTSCVQIRVCKVCTRDEFVLDPLPFKCVFQLIIFYFTQICHENFSPEFVTFFSCDVGRYFSHEVGINLS